MPALLAVWWGYLLAFLYHAALPPFLFTVGLVLVLASFGKSLGVRRLYVRTLLRIFEYAGRVSIAEHRRRDRETFRRSFKVGGGDGQDSDSESDAGFAEEEDGDTFTGNGDVANGAAARKAALMKDYNKESRHNVISRKDNLILVPDKPEKVPSGSEPKEWATKALAGKEVSAATLESQFELEDILDYIKTGVASVIEDEVTQRFVAEELKSWNLLTRTTQSFEFVDVRLTVIWITGFFVRYFILLPGRALILIVGLIWMTVCMAFIGQLPEGELKKWLHYQCFTSCFQILGGAISAVITYHNPENMPKDGICVANHTSPIDVLILACDNAYALIGQRHGGFIAVFQETLSKCAHHIWFERSESKDRQIITQRLRDHVEDPNKLPILIFPEGTCINNTSVMQFKKGCFEVGGTIYPVAIKYDPKFGDAFWNSSQNGMLSYLFLMMSSWAIVCDVWYLPPMRRRESEDAVAFANRVKAEIARQGGLVDLMWDGNLKRGDVKSEWKERAQQDFAKKIM